MSSRAYWGRRGSRARLVSSPAHVITDYAKGYVAPAYALSGGKFTGSEEKTKSHSRISSCGNVNAYSLKDFP